jgi:hypothetical protein
MVVSDGYFKNGININVIGTTGMKLTIKITDSYLANFELQYLFSIGSLLAVPVLFDSRVETIAIRAVSVDLQHCNTRLRQKLHRNVEDPWPRCVLLDPLKNALRGHRFR